MAQQDIAPTDAGDTSLTKIEANFTELYGNVEDLQDGTQLHALTDKTTPADADEIGLVDSAASNVLKKLTWANLQRGIGSGWIPVADSWSYASADAPTFVITIPAGGTSLYSPGMRIKLTQTTVKYFIITAVTSTTLTVYGGTDYTLTNAAISAISYSTQKAPLGFPISPAKWTVEVTDVTERTQTSPVQNTWYNLGGINISVPIGSWKLDYLNAMGADRASSTASILTQTTLSTANNSESDADLTSMLYLLSSTSDADGLMGSQFRNKTLEISSKTTYYANVRTISASVGNIYFRNAQSKMIIRAVCAYL